MVRRAGKYGADDDDDDDDALPPSAPPGAPQPPASQQNDSDRKQPAIKRAGAMASNAPRHSKELQLAAGSNHEETIENRKRQPDSPRNAAKPGPVAVAGNSAGPQYGKARMSQTVAQAPGEYASFGESTTAGQFSQGSKERTERASKPGPVAVPGGSSESQHQKEITDKKMRQSDILQLAPGNNDEISDTNKLPSQPQSRDSIEKEKAAYVDSDYVYKNVSHGDSASARANTGTRRSHRSRASNRDPDDEDVVSIESEEDEDMIPGAMRISGMRASNDDNNVVEDDYTAPAPTEEAPLSPDANLAKAIPVEEDEEVMEPTIDEEALKNAVIAEEVGDMEEFEETKGIKGWILRHRRITGLLVLLGISVVIATAILATNDVIGPPEVDDPPTISREEAALQEQSERFREAFDILKNFNSPDVLLFDDMSPQHIALRWIADEDPGELDFNTTASDLVTQRYGLAVLYFSTNGDEWEEDLGFLTEVTECEWTGTGEANQQKGVTGCNEDSFITSLRMPSIHMNGTIPTELSFFSSLDLLDLGNNILTGTIPTEIATLSVLRELRLPGNLLTGTIPNNIGSLTRLETLFIQVNDLSGEIPSTVDGLVRLRNWNGSFNKLVGTIPSEIGLLENLRIFFTQQNDLTGSLPSTMAGMTSLRQLDVSYNNFVDGAENLCGITSLVVFAADCFSQLIPAVESEICCPCCSLCCSEVVNRCDGNTASDQPCV